MRVHQGELPGLVVLEPDIFTDDRGFFLETYRFERYREHGVAEPFVQDNLSQSKRGVLRGLHLQEPDAQGKLVMALAGRVYDVAVDVRLGSPTFGRWAGVELDGESLRQFYIPPGFAHGFVVLSDTAVFHYKCTAPYVQSSELTIRWDDPALGIDWPIRTPELSPRDSSAPLLREISVDRLPRYVDGGSVAP